MPIEVSMGQRVMAVTRGRKQDICVPNFKFAPQGESNLVTSELLSHLLRYADELCLLKSTHMRRRKNASGTSTEGRQFRPLTCSGVLAGGSLWR